MVARYKIKTQKSTAFQYISDKQSEDEIKKAIPFIIESKRIKLLGIKQPKNCKTCVQETEHYCKKLKAPK